MNKIRKNLVSGLFFLGVSMPIFSAENIPIYSHSNDRINISNTLNVPNQNSFSTISKVCSTNVNLFTPCITNQFTNQGRNSYLHVTNQRRFNNFRFQGTLSKNLDSGILEGNYNLRYNHPERNFTIVTNLRSVDENFRLANTIFQASLPNELGNIRGRVNFDSQNRIQSKNVSFHRENFGTSYFENANNLRRISIEHRTIRPKFELRTGIGTEFFPDRSISSSFNINLVYYLNN